MTAYIIRRILFMIPTIFGIMLVSFVVVQFAPGGPIERVIAQLSGNGARGHVVQIVDPAEETFPYWGRIEFIEPEGGGRITAGRAETWRTDYTARLARHRAEIRGETDRLGWSFIIHRTDRPASELLLALHARIGAAAVAEFAAPPSVATESRVPT